MAEISTPEQFVGLRPRRTVSCRPSWAGSAPERAWGAGDTESPQPALRQRGGRPEVSTPARESEKPAKTHPGEANIGSPRGRARPGAGLGPSARRELGLPQVAGGRVGGRTAETQTSAPRATWLLAA